MRTDDRHTISFKSTRKMLLLQTIAILNTDAFRSRFSGRPVGREAPEIGR
jgi:hypothetical protein